MSEPGTETPAAPSVEDRMAALEKMRGDLEAERSALTAERTGMQTLATTLAEIVAQTRPAQVEPEPELPTEEEWEQNRQSAVAKLTQAQLREGLRAYDSVRGAEIDEVKSALVDVEWERVRQEDPKNFGRLEATMRAYFTKHPAEKRPGAVKEAFTRLRGIHYTKLQEMDRAERQSEPVIDPAPGGQPPRKGKEADTFSAHEVKAIRGLGADPRHYFLAKHGREPNFGKDYLSSVGLRLQEEPAK